MHVCFRETLLLLLQGQKDFIIVMLTIIVLALWRAESVFDDKLRVCVYVCESTTYYYQL